MIKQISIIVLFCMIPVMAHGISGGGAINMIFNTSARAEGMGSAGVAVTWDTDTNHWANPALLAFRPGLHYRKFDSQLAVGLADDIFLTNEEISFGAYGLTFLFAQGPVEGNYLSMGDTQMTDENGDSIYSYESYLRSESWGLGANGVEILEYLLGKDAGHWSNYVSFAGGMTKHDFRGVMGWENLPREYGIIGGDTTSWGYVLSAKYGDLTIGGGVMDNGFLGLEFGGSYGASILNKTDDLIRRLDSDQSDPFSTIYIKGWAANVQVTLADDMREQLNDMGFGILGDMINPLISFTKTEQLMEPGILWNSDSNSYSYEHDTSGYQEERGRGRELGLLNIFYIRNGHVLVEDGEIDGETEGGGWKIQAGRFGGFRKDWAEVPQARGLPIVRRETWSVWVNPLEIYNELSN